MNGLKEYLFNIRKKIAQNEVSRDWNTSDLEKVLKNLKNDRARDAYGHIYELFKYGG